MRRDSDLLIDQLLAIDNRRLVQGPIARLSNAINMVLQGDIVDGMTIIAVLHAARLRGLVSTEPYETLSHLRKQET